jgi:hypothetical protein
MNKSTTIIILTLALILTACGGNASNAAGRATGTQSGASAGALSVPLQVAIGTLKLDKTANEVTTDQAAKLLPLWETLQVLDTSDTAANQEKDALIAQIQETMTQNQMQAITSMNLTRQDMFSVMQSQGLAFGGGQNATGTAQNGNSSTNSNRRNSGNGGGGGFFVGGGGPPPDGGAFPNGGGGNFQGQGTRTQSNGSTQNSTRQVTANPNRIPTPLVQAVIDYLKKMAGPSYP